MTILGTGGVGKTHFALELAARLQSQFQHGVVFLPLVSLRKADELLPALAGSLRVHLPSGDDLKQVVLDHLSSREMLLVLDNFEHLLEEALLIRDILDAAPRVRVLVTTREKLKLESEILYSLRGLTLPPIDKLHQAEEYDSVRLFLQKARQVRPGFALTDENRPAVVHVCQLVDGLPLGILLAAAWVEHFSPAEIADQIQRSLDFLAHDLRDAPSRHTCIRAAFDISFHRLSESHKAVFRKLGCFRGVFTLAAAEAVAGADLRTLINLADKSLLWRDPDSGRYDLHELLRHYANDELVREGEHEATQAAHAAYYTAFVEERETKLRSPVQGLALDEIQADLDNIRQAWNWAISQRDFLAVQRMLPGLYAFCDMRSRFYEGAALFQLARQGLAPQAGEPPHSTWALALLSWYDLQSYLGRLEHDEEIQVQAQCCRKQAEAVDNPFGIAASVVLLGAIARHQGNFELAIQHYDRAMRVCPELDDFYWVQMRIGLCYQSLRAYPQAIQAFQMCLERGNRTGEQVKTGWSLVNIGDALLLQGNPAQAKVYLEEAFAIFKEVGTTSGLLWSIYSLSRAALDLGDPARARELVDNAQQIAQQLHATFWIKRLHYQFQPIEAPSSESSRIVKLHCRELFSPRELEILHLLKSEMSGPEIARALVVSLNTVRFHTKNIYRKLEANNRLEAIHRADELGL